MTENNQISSSGILIAVLICSAFGFLGAYSIASEPIAYIASMFYGIYFLFLVIPVTLILTIAGFVLLGLKRTRYAVPLLVSCIVLPVSYVGGLKAFEAVGLAQYKDNPVNEMQPIGWDVKERIVIVFKKKVEQDQINAFDESVLRKKVPQPNGVLLAFADGICNFSYPETIPERTVVDIPFCKDATEEQKSKIRDEIIMSPIIDIALEDLASGEVRRLK